MQPLTPPAPVPMPDLTSPVREGAAVSSKWQAPDLAGQPVLVLGHGISGQAMAHWCVRQGACVTWADTREQSDRMAALRAEWPQVEVLSAPLDRWLMDRKPWVLVCKSPGLSPSQLAELEAVARERGVPVRGELALWADGLRRLHAELEWAPRILAITGTNGKTTTTALTGLLLERAGWRVALAGNIGPALLDVLVQVLDSGAALPEAWVLELSSFQLDGVPVGPHGFEPTVAAVLNITQDHLDWHGDMVAYGAAKQRVYGQSGIQILNRDDPMVLAQARAGHPAITFGTDTPQRPGDWGLEVVHGMTWMVRAQPADETRLKGRRRAAATEEVPAEVVLQRLMPADALRIRGRHNAANALAALAMATAAGAPLAPMLHGLRDYRGEPHRVEPVALLNGVEYFDDSKGTNVGATLAAIRGLGADRKLVLILGGEGKGQDFSPLAEPVREHARAAVLIGRDAPRLREALASTGVPLLDAPDMPRAVQWAADQAREGDAVLMSPACASLDMFRDYAHRAEVFVAAVHALAEADGTPGLGLGDAGMGGGQPASRWSVGP